MVTREYFLLSLVISSGFQLVWNSASLSAYLNCQSSSSQSGTSPNVFKTMALLKLPIANVGFAAHRKEHLTSDYQGTARDIP
jgi:hypothetical protein